MTWVLGLGESYDLCLPPFNEPTSARRKNGEHTKRRRWISSFVFLSLFFFFFFFGGWQNFDLPHVKSTQTDQRADFILRHAFLFGRVQ